MSVYGKDLHVAICIFIPYYWFIFFFFLLNFRTTDIKLFISGLYLDIYT